VGQVLFSMAGRGEARHKMLILLKGHFTI